MAVTNSDEDFLFSMQLVTASIFPNSLKAAVDLDLFEIIAKAGPGAQLSPKQIASQLTAETEDVPAMIDRLLRLLASYSVLTSSLITNDDGKVERVYGLASVCKYLVKNEDGVSNVPMMLLMQDHALTQCWSNFKDVLLNGGMPPTFEHFESDGRLEQIFNNSMLGTTTIFIKKLIEIYKGFESVKHLVDVGGGRGITLNIITSKYPSIKGINFDLPHVVQHAPSFPGVEYVGGDMFESVPKSETIFMKWILHDWGDQKSSKLLKNCFEALPAGGKLIIVDAIVPVAVETDSAAKYMSQMDCFMMASTQNHGGRERTEDEFRSLVKGAGFASMTTVVKLYSFGVMECYKQ